VRHPERPAGEVLGQSPLAGQLAMPGDSAWLVVSLGPEQRPVPDVLRLRADWARTVLEASGFAVEVDSVEAELPRGRVAAVDPEPGTAVSIPGRVRLEVSSGPALIAVPLLLGLEQAEAEALIDSLGLVVSEVTTRFRFGRDQGRVVEQDPPPDSLVAPGSPVRLVVGRRRRGRGPR
ncbi:MAG: PASTA domain-containing protein, partial [Gemmatimonadetes bacterium]